MQKPEETMAKVMQGRNPKLLMDIHDVSGVNRPGVRLSELPGAATSKTFEKEK
jgi:NADH-quinone oxidoreductase subunit G